MKLKRLLLEADDTISAGFEEATKVLAQFLLDSNLVKDGNQFASLKDDKSIGEFLKRDIIKNIKQPEIILKLLGILNQNQKYFKQSLSILQDDLLFSYFKSISPKFANVLSQSAKDRGYTINFDKTGNAVIVLKDEVIQLILNIIQQHDDIFEGNTNRSDLMFTVLYQVVGKDVRFADAENLFVNNTDSDTLLKSIFTGDDDAFRLKTALFLLKDDKSQFGMPDGAEFDKPFRFGNDTIELWKMSTKKL